MVAVVIGGVEVRGLMGDRFAPSGGLGNAVDALNDHFTLLGIGVIGLFIALWAASAVIYRYQGLDEIKLTRSEG